MGTNTIWEKKWEINLPFLLGKDEKSKFVKLFLPSDYEQLLNQKNHLYHQNTKSVIEYHKEIFRLGIRANMIEKEPQKVSRYKQRLNSPTRQRLELGQTYWIIHEANS